MWASRDGSVILTVAQYSCTTPCYSTVALLQTGTSKLHRSFLSVWYLSGLCFCCEHECYTSEAFAWAVRNSTEHTQSGIFSGASHRIVTMARGRVKPVCWILPGGAPSHISIVFWHLCMYLFKWKETRKRNQLRIRTLSETHLHESIFCFFLHWNG